MKYDVFLSYSRQDHAIVERIGAVLERVGLACFLDQEEILPGDRWQKKTAEALKASRAFVCAIGPSGPGDWQGQEFELANKLQTKTGKPEIIPLILVGGRSGVDELPFLENYNFVKFEEGAVDALVKVVQGVKQGLTDVEREEWEERILQAWEEREKGSNLVDHTVELGFEERLEASDMVIAESLLPYMLNRKVEIGQLNEALREQRRSGHKSLVCVLHGTDHDCLDRFQERLQKEELPRALGLNEMEPVKPYYLGHRPGEYPGMDVLHRFLDDELRRALRLESTSSRADMLDVIIAHPGPVMIHTMIEFDGRYSPEALKAFVQYWDDWPYDIERPGPLVFLFISYPAKARKGGWWNRKATGLKLFVEAVVSTMNEMAAIEHQNVVLTYMQECLPPIENQDLVNWANEYGQTKMLGRLQAFLEEHGSGDPKKVPLALVASEIQKHMQRSAA